MTALPLNSVTSWCSYGVVFIMNSKLKNAVPMDSYLDKFIWQKRHGTISSGT